MGRARRRIGAVLALLVIATACSSPADEPDRIAQRYSALAELAEALDLAGLCDEFKRSRSFAGMDLGRCHSRPEDFRGKRLSLRLTFFSDADEYDKRKRGDSSGCGGPYIYGPNWNVSVLGFGVIPRVEDAVGGEIVGFHERDC